MASFFKQEDRLLQYEEDKVIRLNYHELVDHYAFQTPCAGLRVVVAFAFGSIQDLGSRPDGGHCFLLL